MTRLRVQPPTGAIISNVLQTSALKLKDSIGENTKATTKRWNSQDLELCPYRRARILPPLKMDATASAQDCDHENCPCLFDFYLLEENQLLDAQVFTLKQLYQKCCKGGNLLLAFFLLRSGGLAAIGWTYDKFIQSGHSSTWALLTTQCYLKIPDSFWAKSLKCWSLTLFKVRGKNLQKKTPLPRLESALPFSSKSLRWDHHKTKLKGYLLQTSWRSETWRMGRIKLTMTYFK